MTYSLFKKCILFGIILVLVGVIYLPYISGNSLKSNISNEIKIEKDENYIYTYNKPNDAINNIENDNSLYLTKDEFGLYEYIIYNPISNHDYFEQNRPLKFRKIERVNNEKAFEKINNNFGIKNKFTSRESNPYTINKNLYTPSKKFSGNKLFVGGIGPNNYTNIQDAINAANNYDTIFVYAHSSPYYEHIIIDKSIDLIGEDRDTTIINGSLLNSTIDTVCITADNVNIDGFSINFNPGDYYQAAIAINGNYATIYNCKIYNNNWIGISIIGSSYSKIYNCELFDNIIGIHMIDSSENEIKDCLCYDNSDDIILFQNSHNNQIINCTCFDNGFSGIHIQQSSGNKIINCSVYNGNEGIGLSYAPNTTMRGNILNNNYENFGIGSPYFSDFFCDIDASNLINGKPIYYWIDNHNKQLPADAAFIGLIACTNILVKDFEISNNFQGLVSVGTLNSTIENCNFENNGGHGAFFVSSTDNILGNCSSKNNFFTGIYLNSQSSRNTIYNNTFSTIQISGIWIESSKDNFLSKNAISNCIRGIYLDNSGNNILKHNEMVNCGLAVDGASYSDYINNADETNKVNGKTLYYYIDKKDIVIPEDAGEVILINCTYCNISNLDLSDATIGIELVNSSYNLISGNTINRNNLVAIDLDYANNNYNTIKDNSIKDNNYGIDIDFSINNIIQKNIIHNNGVGSSLDTSNNNIIWDNNIKNSWNGIYLTNSDSNSFSNNTISKCGFNGIYLLYSKNNILKANHMTNCGLLVYGNSLIDYINDVDSSNKINGKTLYYLINENDKNIPDDAGEVILVDCNYINISNLELSDGTIGIELAYSNHNTIFNNILNNNKFAGIYLETSSDNIVRKNSIENSSYGISLQLADGNNIINNIIQMTSYGCYIYLSDENIFSNNNLIYNTYGLRFNYPSINNKIHHNNLIGNRFNAYDKNEGVNSWDDGKKGNYWEDYTTIYPEAKKIWLKGIWNTPYEIPDEKNFDRYPLIIPIITKNGITVNSIYKSSFDVIFSWYQLIKNLFLSFLS